MNGGVGNGGAGGAAGGGAAVGPAGGPAAGAPAAGPVIDPGAAALALVQNLPDEVGDQVLALEHQQRDLKRQKQNVLKELKSQRKKQQRLMDKAKNRQVASQARASSPYGK